MRTRRSLFGALLGSLAATIGGGQARGPEPAAPVDRPLADLLRKLRAARAANKTPILEEVAEELARRQQMLGLEIRALEARSSACPCPEEEREDSDDEICRSEPSGRSS